jgi:hypothetical protein
MRSYNAPDSCACVGHAGLNAITSTKLPNEIVLIIFLLIDCSPLLISFLSDRDRRIRHRASFN